MKNHENIRKIATLRGYARSRAARGLPGGSAAAVQRARDSGRLDAAIVQTADGAICVDVAAADAAWSAATRKRIDYEIERSAPTAADDEPDGFVRYQSYRRELELEDALVRIHLEPATDLRAAALALMERLIALWVRDGADGSPAAWQEQHVEELVDDVATAIEAERRARRRQPKNGDTR